VAAAPAARCLFVSHVNGTFGHSFGSGLKQQRVGRTHRAEVVQVRGEARSDKRGANLFSMEHLYLRS
jgi:hypothetical protein